MPRKRISALAHAINASRYVSGPDRLITGITNDSRSVRPGDLYAALPGEHVDGHRFIATALRKGAVAILCAEPPVPLPDHAAVLQTETPRLALSELADVFYDRPSERLEVIGVTGTDGKTTTVSFIHQLLTARGFETSYLSTAATKVGSREAANVLHQSTPEAPVTHQTLYDMAESGSRFAVLESTSHGLSGLTCRLAHVRYRAAVLTNISHEHLEFHGSYARYRHDKANLFRALDWGRYAAAPGYLAPVVGREHPGTVREWPEDASTFAAADRRFGIVNQDSPEAAYFAGATSSPVFGYSLFRGRGAAWAADLQPDSAGTRFQLGSGGAALSVRLSIPGEFNVQNALAAALTVALLTGEQPVDLARAIEKLRPVRGRMNVVCTAPFTVIVDYAHTPGAFEWVLPFFRRTTSGRLIVVFGSAGERDTGKRPIQGAIADRFADLIVLTDEDPRGESRVAILDDIARGCPSRAEGETLLKIPDRRAAIAAAFARAGEGDTVLLLGKGHETSIIGSHGWDPWDEETAAQDELRKMGVEV